MPKTSKKAVLKGGLVWERILEKYPPARVEQMAPSQRKARSRRIFMNGFGISEAHLRRVLRGEEISYRLAFRFEEDLGPGLIDRVIPPAEVRRGGSRATVHTAEQRDRARLGRLHAEIDDLRRKRDEEADGLCRDLEARSAVRQTLTSDRAALKRVQAERCEALDACDEAARRAVPRTSRDRCAGGGDLVPVSPRMGGRSTARRPWVVAANASLVAAALLLVAISSQTVRDEFGSTTAAKAPLDNAIPPAEVPDVAKAPPDNAIPPAEVPDVAKAPPDNAIPLAEEIDKWLTSPPSEEFKAWVAAWSQVGIVSNYYGGTPTTLAAAGCCMEPLDAAVLEMFPRDRGNSIEFIKLGEVSPPSVKFAAKEWATLEEAVNCEPVYDKTLQMIYEGRVNLLSFHEECHVDPQIVVNMLPS